MKVWKHIGLCAFAALLSLVTFAQTRDDVDAVFKKVDEANKSVVTDPQRAYGLATEALDLSFATKDKKGEASVYNTLGTLYYNSKNYNKAIAYFNKAIQIYKTIDDDKNEEYALKYLAKSYEALGNQKQTLNYYEQASKKTSSDSARTKYVITNSKVNKKLGNKKKAIQDLENELNTNSKLSDADKVDIYLELGDLYIEEKDTSQGVELIKKAIVQSKVDNAKAPELYWNTLNSASSIYNDNGLEEENIKTQREAMVDPSNSGNAKVQQYTNFNIGNSIIKTNPQIAAQYLEKSAEIAEQNPKEDQDRIKAVEKLSEAYEKSGDYVKALATYKQYILLVDSLKQSEIESRLKTELLSAKYEIQETKIKDLEFKQLEKEKEIDRKQQTILGLGIGIALMLLLSYFLFKNIQQKQRSNRLIQLASLRSQMNPHFIFNSLNSVNGFISNNEERKANRYISDFSKLMRSVLNNSSHETITLQEEIDSLKIYLALEHSRFEDKFDFEINVDPNLDLQSISVPPMLVQPYIENAIWHGLRYKEDKGFLSLSFSDSGNEIDVKVEDNGIGREASQKLKTIHQRDYKSTGIENTKERIRLLNSIYKTDLSVAIEDLTTNEVAVGTKVVLKLPKRLES